MSRQPLQLTLQQKALILVAVPLLFEVVLLVTLFWAYKQQEDALAKANHVKKIIAITETLVEDIYDIGYTFIAYNAKQEDVYEKRYYDAISISKKQIDILRQQVQGLPGYRVHLANAENRLNKALNMLSADKLEIESGEVFNVQHALHLKAEVKLIADELRKYISNEEERSLKLIQEHLKQLNQLIPFLILFGVVASIGLAIILASIFQKSTADRLMMLMSNISNLQKNQKLNPVLSGNDEIAQIDRVFHDMADALHESARQKQEFVDMISHDLRTPLSSVKTSLAVLNTGAWGELNEKGKHKIVVAEDNIRRSIELINNLLDIEKMESGKVEIVLRTHDLAPILDMCVESVSQLAEQKNINITVADTMAKVQADDSKLSQVVINLLGNALKFSPSGTEVLITVLNKNPFVEVRIKDNGPGIPQEFQKRIFNRFEQLPGDDPSKSLGSGLGLSICRLIIEAHGGEIGVESQDGVGSTFWFTVPKAE